MCHFGWKLMRMNDQHECESNSFFFSPHPPSLSSSIDKPAILTSSSHHLYHHYHPSLLHPKSFAIQHKNWKRIKAKRKSYINFHPLIWKRMMMMMMMMMQKDYESNQFNHWIIEWQSTSTTILFNSNHFNW